jgi:hypothetical protein
VHTLPLWLPAGKVIPFHKLQAQELYEGPFSHTKTHNGRKYPSAVPPNTGVLLCHDSYFMSCTDMSRHQKRIRNMINTHSTTLIPLFDSVHGCLVEVNPDTRTFTFYNSYGKHGQRKWSPTLKAWLTHHMHGPWTAAQEIATQQPGTTECGTHTLLNIMKHIPGAPSPDTSRIHWSHLI